MLRLTILLFGLIAAGATVAADLSGQASVVDGDTLEIHGQRIRLFGIDAPESRQTCEAVGQTYRCGQQAALALADHIGQLTVACEPRDTDRYGRIVAACDVSGEDLSAWLVSQAGRWPTFATLATRWTKGSPPGLPRETWRGGVRMQLTAERMTNCSRRRL